jgi:hypothetical protein
VEIDILIESRQSSRWRAGLEPNKGIFIDFRLKLLFLFNLIAISIESRLGCSKEDNWPFIGFKCGASKCKTAKQSRFFGFPRNSSKQFSACKGFEKTRRCSDC